MDMALDSLLAAPLIVQVHAFAAMAAFALGIVQLAAPKGTLPHRTLGYTWVGSMLLVAVSSFAIHGRGQWGGFSAIHLLSILVLALTPLAVLAAHRHRVVTHRWAMIGLFAGALIIAGAFTLLPGRIMHRVVFGASRSAARRRRRRARAACLIHACTRPRRLHAVLIADMLTM
jgi:uncharacterized membrane protein